MTGKVARAALICVALLAPTYGMAASKPSPAAKVVSVKSSGLSDRAADVPFGTGEKSSFDVRFGSIRVGSGSLEVIGVESVRGHDTWHTSFTVQGGTFFYRVNDSYESWIDTQTLNSLLFTRQIEEGTRERTQNFEILPEKGVYIERSGDFNQTFRTVSNPLDEAAFLYRIEPGVLSADAAAAVNAALHGDLTVLDRLNPRAQENGVVSAPRLSAD